MNTSQIELDLQEAKQTLRSGNTTRAETLYRDILAADPDCAEATHFLGLAAMNRKSWDDALRLMRRSIELQPGRGEFYNNIATLLGRMNRTEEALRAADRAIELRPESPEAWNNKGFALKRLKHLPEAITAFRRALELRRDYVEAKANLADALYHTNNHDEAASWLAEVASHKPKNVEVHKKLAAALRRCGRMTEAISAYQTAFGLAPNDADLLNDLGGALQEVGDRNSAIDMLSRCLEIRPDHPDGHWNLALALLAQGRWEEGWPQYEWRCKLRLDAGQKRNFLQRAWDGSDPRGKTLFINCEQGLGDTLQFVRYLSILKSRGARVILECQHPLRLLLRGLKGLDGLTVRGEPLPHFDHYVRLMSLPGIMGTTPRAVPADIPYLFAEQEAREKYGQLLRAHAGVKVGLVWQGRPEHRGDRQRSMQLKAFEPLARVPGISLVSLQKNPGSDQIARVRDRIPILEWADPSDVSPESWVETAGMIANLDLVIGVDTSVCHLSGAMGIPTWIALPFAADWRWMEHREDSPWYPTVRLFRQKTLGDWTDVIARITAELSGWTAARQRLHSPTR